MEAYVDVAIGDLFTPTNGKPKYIRDYVNAHPGPYPVYSASLVEPFGFVDEYDFNGTFLSWVMNGYGGRMQILDGRFSVNRDRGVLVPLENVPTPNLTYLCHAAEPELVAAAVGRRVDGRLNEYTKIYPPAATEVTVRLPIRSDGKFDYAKMDQIGAQLARIEAAQARVSLAQEALASAELVHAVAEPTVTLMLGDDQYFALSIGERVLRRDFVDEGIDVYSANVLQPFGRVRRSNLTDFSAPSLLWGIDGTFDWNLVPAGIPFSTTDHCGRLQLLDDRLSPEYVLQYLRATRAEYGFDRVFRASLTNVSRNVHIKVPTDGNGHVSLQRQVQLASERQRVLDAQATTIAALAKVLRARMTAEL
jgi:hypothetical protein